MYNCALYTDYKKEKVNIKEVGEIITITNLIRTCYLFTKM